MFIREKLEVPPGGHVEVILEGDGDPNHDHKIAGVHVVKANGELVHTIGVSRTEFLKSAFKEAD